MQGWGAQSWAQWDKDEKIATFIAQMTSTPVMDSPLINEGGGIHVNGAGTGVATYRSINHTYSNSIAVLLTDTVQLGEGRNSSWSKEEVEKEVHAKLGTHTAVWLPRGLTRGRYYICVRALNAFSRRNFSDYEEFGTRGHVDMVACFVSPTTVLYHDQRNPAHPDHALSQQVRDIIVCGPCLPYFFT